MIIIKLPVAWIEDIQVCYNHCNIQKFESLKKLFKVRGISTQDIYLLFYEEKDRKFEKSTLKNIGGVVKISHLQFNPSQYLQNEYNINVENCDFLISFGNHKDIVEFFINHTIVALPESTQFNTNNSSIILSKISFCALNKSSNKTLSKLKGTKVRFFDEINNEEDSLRIEEEVERPLKKQKSSHATHGMTPSLIMSEIEKFGVNEDIDDQFLEIFEKKIAEIDCSTLEIKTLECFKDIKDKFSESRERLTWCCFSRLYDDLILYEKTLEANKQLIIRQPIIETLLELKIEFQETRDLNSFFSATLKACMKYNTDNNPINYSSLTMGSLS